MKLLAVVTIATALAGCTGATRKPAAIAGGALALVGGSLILSNPFGSCNEDETAGGCGEDHTKVGAVMLFAGLGVVLLAMMPDRADPAPSYFTPPPPPMGHVEVDQTAERVTGILATAGFPALAAIVGIGTLLATTPDREGVASAPRADSIAPSNRRDSVREEPPPPPPPPPRRRAAGEWMRGGQ